MIDRIKDALKQSEWSFEYFGLRVHHSSRKLVTGKRAPCSYRWIDEGCTCTKLRGTCAIEIKRIGDIDSVLAIAQQYMHLPNAHIALLGCNDRPGTGQDKGEIIMHNATVIEVF